MESKPVSTKQKESLVIILIDNVPVSISTKRYNHLIEWIDRYNSYQIGLEIYPPESNIHKQYAIKSNIPLKTKLKMKNLVHFFLAILYYLMVFSFIIVILSIGYQFLKWIWE